MRIHVWLAKYTDLSRRAAEAAVVAGRVRVNKNNAEVGQKVDEHSEVFLDGKRVRQKTLERQLIALHKPVGYVCSRKPQDGQVSVYDLLPKVSAGKWILIGRLDVNTSGLLLATTDGILANQLAHPSQGFQREYLVRASKSLSEAEVNALLKGVKLDDGMASVKKIKLHKANKGKNTWYNLILTEGRNRIVRRLMASQGANVSRLVRVRFGPIKLDKALGVGKYQAIDAAWIDKILRHS